MEGEGVKGRGIKRPADDGLLQGKEQDEEEGEEPKKDESGEDAGVCVDGSGIMYGRDQKDYVRNTFERIFFGLGSGKVDQMAMDKVAVYSTTDRRSAQKISKEIAKYVSKRSIITDGCACVGGNVLAFAEFFAHVNAVELDPTRFIMLENNLKVAGLRDKVTLYQGSYLEQMASLVQDVIFLDPPWGGRDYKEKDVELGLGDIPLSQICEAVSHTASYIVLKLPQTFNTKEFEVHAPSCQVLVDNDRLGWRMKVIILECPGPWYKKDDLPREWEYCRSTSKPGQCYLYNNKDKSRVWVDNTLPENWGVKNTEKDGENVYVNIKTGEVSNDRPPKQVKEDSAGSSAQTD